ncbi:hypothetical protein MCP_0533 [Methanocella paludicola SANAE]|uniref:Uncharacterized protein n=1 Tax=Methanocella paludicola (strain DSM 17711 / JCM 13418 / NBRC 101707 / SANAE) TaxID=304371 RepID=D1YVY3_METPS|nr:hypothetical protein [Methanocella paludicola]BAI60605.1 hypothetical protein MCP_0533 [Methanocella paludicola SANAE]
MPEKDSTGQPGESSDGNDLDPGKSPEDPMASGTPENEDKDKAMVQEGRSPICASGHCCGRRKARKIPISQYFGDN